MPIYATYRCAYRLFLRKMIYQQQMEGRDCNGKKIKMLLEVFEKAALGIMLAAAIYISIFVGELRRI